MSIDVIIPTVPGREDELEQVIAEFQEHTRSVVEVWPQYGHTNVADGWNAGVKNLKRPREFTLFSNDDVHPHDGWDVDALKTIDEGATPVPVCWRPDGSVESGGVFGRALPEGSETDWTPLCLFRADEWKLFGPLPSVHYYADNAFAAASLKRLKRKLVVRHRYAFTHTWAMPGRRDLHGTEGEAHRVVFERWVARL